MLGDSWTSAISDTMTIILGAITALGFISGTGAWMTKVYMQLTTLNRNVERLEETLHESVGICHKRIDETDQKFERTSRRHSDTLKDLQIAVARIEAHSPHQGPGSDYGGNHPKPATGGT